MEPERDNPAILVALCRETFPNSYYLMAVATHISRMNSSGDAIGFSFEIRHGDRPCNAKEAIGCLFRTRTIAWKTQ
jgi:hypothetical protein